MICIGLTDSDYDEKLREIGNYLWDLEQEAVLARAEGRQAVVQQIELKILRQAERAHSFHQIAGSHRILAAFVAGLGYRMIRRWPDKRNRAISEAIAPKTEEFETTDFADFTD
jgi:hypothetical protein